MTIRPSERSKSWDLLQWLSKRFIVANWHCHERVDHKSCSLANRKDWRKLLGTLDFFQSLRKTMTAVERRRSVLCCDEGQLWTEWRGVSSYSTRFSDVFCWNSICSAVSSDEDALGVWASLISPSICTWVTRGGEELVGRRTWNELNWLREE